MDVGKLGAASLDELLATMQAPLAVVDGELRTQLPAETALVEFTKAAEMHRRVRLRRVAAGDATAALRFAKPPATPAVANRRGAAVAAASA